MEYTLSDLAGFNDPADAGTTTTDEETEAGATALFSAAATMLAAFLVF